MAGVDQHVLAQALAEARRRRATPREIKALVEAGLVESGFQNVPLGKGDRDSQGFLQQRASQGWTGLMDVPKATAEFLSKAHALNAKGFHGSAGQLAQAVQRSAFPARYDERAGDARKLLGQAGPMPAGAAPGAVAASADPGAPATQDQPAGLDVASLLSAMTQQKPQVQSAGIQAPAFSAQAVMPQGAQLPQGGGGPAPQQDVSQLLAIVGAAGQGQGLPAGTSQGTGQAPQSPGAAPAQGSGGSVSGHGEVRIAPGANRAGVGLTPGILKVVRAVAAQAGEPLTVGTGTNHNRLTVDGNVSDHYSGNATDIPSSGDKLTRLGQEALIAAGMDPAEARKQTGGLFNVPYGKHRRIQIIFNTKQGGNHYNHLHVGVTAK